MRGLSDYLDIEDTVKLIKEVTKVPFFNKGNLFDLVVKRELQPIVYFDGYGSTWVNKAFSPYPEDFANDYDWSDDCDWPDDFDPFRNDEANYSAQSSHVKGYFYILHGDTIMNSEIPVKHRRFIIQNLVNYQIIPNYSLPNQGLNSKGGIFKKTPLYTNDTIILSTENPQDEIIDPCFSEKDIKFYVLDIINMIEKYGYYSADEKQKDSPANDKDLNLKDSAYCLIAVLKDLLLNPDIGAYHFKSDNENSSNKPSQTGLASYIDEMKIFGIKKDNINILFQEANKKLKDIKKKS